MHVTLRQLQVFRAIATLGQVQLAARQLYMSQPATSMALSELEKHLSCQLFDRTGNRLVLNAEGNKLLPFACELLDRSAEISRLFDHSDHHRGKVTIGASTTIGNYLLPEVLARFEQAKPDITVELDIHNTTTIINKLATLEIDLACVEGLCQHPDIETIPWREDHLALFCSSKHPLAKSKTVTLENLEQTEWILRESGSGTRMLFELHIGQHLRQRCLKMELNQTEAIKNMVRSGIGISCLSELCIANELAQGELVRLPFPKKNMKRQLWFSTLESV
ncbi:LysR substrate-binding domain-containing protein [Endozoicomonas sp. SCSIO W0465]|uniref:LysR substrate-binding domain-containing protein n=1 Tax=Endozoicomonas sp. SCSIO W0465 TaxID=2918516 RepID=UPI002074D71C|nr:LysR substrate-binding domain-containing protein [Endozoicomonas sp. SCSIO W0465]USE35625.1 LysR substrate-binding domain-containing protein [Endozoicomonas sp. SCSIO W0465]